MDSSNCCYSCVCPCVQMHRNIETIEKLTDKEKVYKNVCISHCGECIGIKESTCALSTYDTGVGCCVGATVLLGCAEVQNFALIPAIFCCLGVCLHGQIHGAIREYRNRTEVVCCCNQGCNDFCMALCCYGCTLTEDAKMLNTTNRLSANAGGLTPDIIPEDYRNISLKQ